MDERIKKLAYNLVNYSCDLQKGEKIWINCGGQAPMPLAKEIIKEVYKVGGIPFVEMKMSTFDREILLGASDEQLIQMAEYDAKKMNDMDAYISVRADGNLAEMADVSSEIMARYERLYGIPVHHNIRVAKTKWVVLRYPSPNMAQKANTSTEAFEDFYFQVCNLDYSKMDKAMDPLSELMARTKKVHIKGPGTDISFSIENIPNEKCAGLRNIPDGEIYTAPVKNSVNGVIQYNTPSSMQGFTFENVKLTFKDGKIIEATANDTGKINQILDTDEGARYIGEFAIGINPYITKPMNDILFDEKIAGSIHFTPGNAYTDADNGNRSAIHWDLVLIQTPEYGGGEIYFDDVLIRKDGRFLLEELLPLNPENLM